MIFDVFYPFTNKAGKLCPGIRPVPTQWEDIRKLSASPEVGELIDKIRTLSGDEKQQMKKSLPGICYTARCTGTRSNANATPTGLVMVDIDHVDNPQNLWGFIRQRLGEEYTANKVLLAHVTPSGKGLRIIFIAPPDFSTLPECQSWFFKDMDVSTMGDVDTAVKDYSRLSYLFKLDDILFENILLQANGNFEQSTTLVNDLKKTDEESPKKGELFADADSVGAFTEDEQLTYEGYDYKGTPLKQIIEKWVEVQGTPGKGEIHNYYNEMVKNFRNIVNNDKRALLYLLPRFGHSAEECWSSIKSICKVNTLSTLPRPFYFFLKDNGFYKPRVPSGRLQEYMLSEDEPVVEEGLPWFPPVFREFVRISPKDFRVSMVNALLPVMGTLTSFLGAPYYYDGRIHTTSFFSIIYAPPGTGKGFAERITNLLFENIKIRDYVQSARENVYLRALNKKSNNDQSPDMPHTSLRIIPPKNSEAEFLQKQKDNCGYHMFTFAPEMDSWAKGVKAAGGNKDDMIRIAWDNGEYGQQFRSANTFKGTVNLYWNVLITGTVQQLFSYFKNVENGLITRCSFTSIENQEFAPAPVWKQLNKKETANIRRFIDRCDRNTYTEPCTLLPEDVDVVEDSKFDEEIKWQFTFRERKIVNMDWLRPTIDKFLNEQLAKAALDLDNARDVFRRRVAVRGFRLGLICMALWDNPKKADLLKCVPFIEWWMNKDIESDLALWGTRYNTETQASPTLPQRSLFAELKQAFTKNDVYAQCVKQGIKTPVRVIISQWFRMGFITKNGKNEYEKVVKK